MDSQPLSPDDTWRLRVASAHVFSIVKSRDVQRFESAMGFLESTYRLFPGLVAPIKHMKLLFGLKTMVIMWMLRAGRGMVETLCKIIKFFPSKLPQYQDQCTRHDMFLMRKNHLDFKTLAQALALDKEKRKDYMKKHVDEQYGECYARRVEDRLLHYLQRLDTALPGDTYVEQVLKRSSPVTEEEKQLLEIVTRDSVTIATALKRLLHCGLASCHEASVSQAPGDRRTPVQSSAKALLQPVKGQVCRGAEEAGSKDGPQQRKEGGDEGQQVSQRSTERAPSPQFCLKHHRWVTSILQECPDESSEELQPQAGLSSSPVLFRSSSSASSSQDLTPSGLVPCPPDQRPPSQSISQLHSPAQASEDEHVWRPGSDTSQEEPLRRPSSPRDIRPPALLSPVVRLVDIVIAKGCPTIQPQQPSPRGFTRSDSNELFSVSAPQVPAFLHCPASGNEDSIFYRPEGVDPSNIICQPRSSQTFTRRSTKQRQTRTRHSPALSEFSQICLGERCKKAPALFQMSRPPVPDISVSGRAMRDASTSTSWRLQSGSLSSVPSSAEFSKAVVTQISSTSTPHPQEPEASAPVVSSASSAAHAAVSLGAATVPRAQARPSVPGQAAAPPESALLQPRVIMWRLSSHECCRITEGRCSATCVEPVMTGRKDKELRREEDEHTDSSFDPNTLYSSRSSSSDSEDSADWDPDYKPCVRRKRLLQRYEVVPSLKRQRH